MYFESGKRFLITVTNAKIQKKLTLILPQQKYNSGWIICSVA